jgi:c-di-GMP-related signal transduction protein
MCPDIDGDVATTDPFGEHLFHHWHGYTGRGEENLFINFTQNLLEKKIPLLLPKETTVIEILEDVQSPIPR